MNTTTMQLNPNLNLNDQCEAAFKFYAECFGGKKEWCRCHFRKPSGQSALACLSIASAYRG
jgi:hypothetical protein